MDEKKAYIERMEAQLTEWSTKIGELAAKAEKAAADAKMAYQREIESLRAKQEAAKKKLHEMREAADEVWEGFKGGVENAWDELKNAVDSVVSKFK